MHHIVVHYGDMLQIHSNAIQGLYEHGWMGGWMDGQILKGSRLQFRFYWKFSASMWFKIIDATVSFPFTSAI